MGQQASSGADLSENHVDGKWCSAYDSADRYFSWCSDPITSENPVEKEGAYTLGPFKKKYTKSMFDQWIFTPPASVDGLPILCQCRDIGKYLETAGIMSLSRNVGALGGNPACWDDDNTLSGGFYGDEFHVNVKDVRFRLGAAIDIAKDIVQLAGRRTIMRKRKLERRDRRTRRRQR